MEGGGRSGVRTEDAGREVEETGWARGGRRHGLQANGRTISFHKRTDQEALNVLNQRLLDLMSYES